MSTTMSAALERAGLSKEQMQLFATASKFIISGGTLEAWIDVYKAAAAKMPSVGQDDNAACSGRSAGADARQPIASRGGLTALAGNGHATRASPAREPSTGLVTAMGASRKATVRTLLDQRKTSDGRAWADVHAYELAGMRRDGALAKAVEGMLGVLNEAQRQKSLRDLMTTEQFATAIAQTERANDDR